MLRMWAVYERHGPTLPTLPVAAFSDELLAEEWIFFQNDPGSWIIQEMACELTLLPLSTKTSLPGDTGYEIG